MEREVEEVKSERKNYSETGMKKSIDEEDKQRK